MSLIAWYPLNGDYKNYGLYGDSAPLTKIINPTFVDGKIGKGLANGTFRWSPEVTEKVLKHNQLTICLWWKNLSSGTGKENIFGTDNLKAGGGRRFSLFRYTTKNDLHWSWQTDTDYNKYVQEEKNTVTTSGIIKNALPDDKWVHICIVYNSPNADLYLNGEFVQRLTDAYDMNDITLNYETTVIWNSNSRVMNDLRFYDHSLSPKEIKEISKGLVVHYDFDNVFCTPEQYINIETIANGSSITLGSDDVGTYFIKPAGAGWTQGLTFDSKTIEAGETYTWSLEVMPTTEITGTLVDANTSGGGYSGNDAARESTIYGINGVETTVDGKGTLKANEWNKIYIVSKLQDDVTAPYEYHRFCPPAPSEGEIKVYYRNITYGRGNKKTIYDSSGYGFNADVSMGNFPIDVEDSAVGTSCLKFDGTQRILATNTQDIIDGVLNSNEFSISFWMKTTELNSSTLKYILCCGTTGARKLLHIGIRANNKFCFAFYGNDLDLEFSDKYINKWAYVVCVYQDKKQYVYVNGELIGTGVTSDGLSIEQVDNICIGHRDTASDSYNYKDYLDDLRIYSTALSIEDIETMYKVKTSITKDGMMMCNKFVEKKNEYGEMFKGNLGKSFSITNYKATTSYSAQNYIKNNEFDIKFTSDVNSGSAGFYIGMTTGNFEYTLSANDGYYYYYSFDIKANKTFQIASLGNEKLGRITDGVINTEWQHYVWIATPNNYQWQACVFYLNTTQTPIVTGDSISIKNFHIIRLDSNENLNSITKKSVINSGGLYEMNNSTKIYKEIIENNQLIEI